MNSTIFILYLHDNIKKDSEGFPSLSLIFWLMSKLYYLDHKTCASIDPAS